MKLSKGQTRQLDELHRKLMDSSDTVEEAARKFVEEFRAGASLDKSAVQSAVKVWNDTLAEAREFVGEMAAEIQGYYDEKSECWQESEKGEQVQAMATAWEEWCSAADGICVVEYSVDDIAALVPYDLMIYQLDGLPCSPDEA